MISEWRGSPVVNACCEEKETAAIQFSFSIISYESLLNKDTRGSYILIRYHKLRAGCGRKPLFQSGELTINESRKYLRKGPGSVSQR